MANMDELVNFVSRYQPDFPAAIQGASPEEVAELGRLTGMALPSTYIDYLSWMGRDDGGFDVGGGSTTQIGTLIEYYVESMEFQIQDIPPNCLVIAVGGGGTFELSLEYQSEIEYPVLFTSGSTIKGRCADSLEKLLFRHAFVKYRLRAWPRSAIYWGGDGDDDNSLKRAWEVARSLGFERQWYSDQIGFCGEGDGSAVAIERILDRPVWMRIAAQHSAEIETLGAAFARRCGMVFQQWWPL
jgi:hypothetical protein